MQHHFTSAILDEEWVVELHRREQHESRFEIGEVVANPTAGHFEARASDQVSDEQMSHLQRNFSRTSDQTGRLLSAIEGRKFRLPLHVRFVTRARRLSYDGQIDLNVRTTITVAADLYGERVVVVTDPDRVEAALDVLTSALMIGPTVRNFDYRELPIVWMGGSGGVLLHEAVGHPAELGAAVAEWPTWLRVVDDPHVDAIGQTSVDDSGQPVSVRILTDGEIPSAERRHGFLDLPAIRMTNLRVESTDSSALELPKRRLEIHLCSSGAYDRMSETVSLRVVHATLVDGSRRDLLAPFDFVEQRSSVASHLRSGGGPLLTYPGVICAEEGQRLPVGTVSPILLTSELSA